MVREKRTKPTTATTSLTFDEGCGVEWGTIGVIVLTSLSRDGV